MHLKFLTIDSENGLLYAEFDYKGEKLRWYPRWSDLSNLFTQAWITENDLNGGKLNSYLAFVCLKIAMDYVLVHTGEQFPVFAEAMQKLEKRLLGEHV